VNEYQGWAQALLENHIPFETVIASKLGTTDLGKYSTLILPDVTCLSDNEINKIIDYVHDGGYVVATGRTSHYDETGNQRAEPGLATLFNDDQGKGKAVYMEEMPGLRYFVPRIGGGRIGEGGVWKDNRNEAMRDLIIETATARQPDPVIKTTNIDPEIVLMPYYHASGEYKGISVHLLNCLGTRNDGIMMIPEDMAFEYTAYPSPYDYIEDDGKMKIAVRSEDVSQAYLISPDFEEVLTLDFTVKDGYCEVTVPGLGRYEIIYRVTGKKDLISDIMKGGAVTKEFPAIVPFPGVDDSTSVQKETQAGVI